MNVLAKSILMTRREQNELLMILRVLVDALRYMTDDEWIAHTNFSLKESLEMADEILTAVENEK
jgi:hypothetical protein